jgi:hypothetical protein
MRVLTTGRALLAPALVAASVATVLALPASAGAAAVPGTAVTHVGGTAAAVTARPGQAPGAAVVRTTAGVELGSAVKYVREPDGTVRRVR